jgi:hypothetical protein
MARRIVGFLTGFVNLINEVRDMRTKMGKK